MVFLKPVSMDQKQKYQIKQYKFNNNEDENDSTENGAYTSMNSK